MTTSSQKENTNSRSSKKKLKRAAKKTKVLKLRSDLAFAKVYFEEKSKRSSERKSVFRKKKSKKK